MSWTWALAAISIIATVCNIKRLRICFPLWALTNAAWTVIDFHAGIYAQSALFFVYFLLALWGIWEWRHTSK